MKTNGMRRVQGVYRSSAPYWVGDGFPVRNLFPSNGLERQVDPFLMLDYAGPANFAPTEEPRGVSEHPHRGFETVTIAYQGRVEHRDSGGNSGIIGPGDVQWMTAASGVVHEERHEREFARRGGTFEMVQLWINLPRAQKMIPPRYQTLLDAQIPRVPLGDGGSYARVIAGELEGHKGPAHTFTPVHVYDVHLTAGVRSYVAIPSGFNAAIVLLNGSVVLNGSDALEGEAKVALLERSGEGVLLHAKEESKLLVLSGQPIDEPVASYGPFVMNTREEIAQAVEDYRAGKMGHLN